MLDQKSKFRGNGRAHRGDIEFWRGVVTTWSGERGTLKAHCEAHGISSGSFYRWRQRLSAAPAVQTSRTAFVPLEIIDDQHASGSDQSSSSMTVTLANGLTIDLHDDFSPEAVVRLVAVLAPPTC